MEVTDEIKAKFWEAAAWPGPNDLDVHRGLAAVLEVVEREHRAALEARADAAYERGISDTRADLAQRIADAYTRGSRDSQALTDLGF